MPRSRSRDARPPRAHGNRPWVFTAPQVVRSRFGRAGEWVTALAGRAGLRAHLGGRPSQCGEEFEWSTGSGTQRVVCGHAWVCPTCSLMARQRDEERISGVVGAWQARGGSVVMVTLTPGPHSQTESLEALLARLDGAWKRVVGSRRPWRAFESRHRIGGVVRVLEVTRGRSGWHPHLHVLLLVEGRPSEDAEAALVADIRARWCAALEAEGSPVPAGSEGTAVQGHLLRRPERGVPVYLAKGHADLLGRLAREVAAGARGAIDVVREFQDATRRRKRIVVSQEAGRRGRILGAFRKAVQALRTRRHGSTTVRRLARWLPLASAFWLTVADSGLPGP